MSRETWHNLTTIEKKSFVCWNCKKEVATYYGYLAESGGRIYICPFCDRPSFFINGEQIPGVPYGENIEHVPDNIKSLYNEARKCVSCSCYTSSVLTCRKLLMNIAVSQGATEGLKFIEYVDCLAGQGYVPPNGRQWVDHIRKKGNEANHEIKLMEKEEAEE